MTSTMEIDYLGNKIWRNEKGEYHREDGPAIEYWNGDKEWWVDGKLHRIEGPACKYCDGYKAYYTNGLRNRIDGPAREWSDGRKEWYVEDKWIANLVRELLYNSPFGEDVHLGILAEYFAERGDFRLQEIIDAAPSKYRQEVSEAIQ